MMRAIYLALQDGLPCPVMRAWPQHPPALPGCVFHLKEWTRRNPAQARVVIAVTLRVNTPQQGDDYAALASAALSPLGLSLLSARDDQEAQTGFFLKALAFEGSATLGADGVFSLMQNPHALRANLLIDGVKIKDASDLSCEWVSEEGRLLRQVRIRYEVLGETEACQVLSAAAKTSLVLTFFDPSAGSNQSLTMRCQQAEAKAMYEKAGQITYGPVNLLLKEV